MHIDRPEPEDRLKLRATLASHPAARRKRRWFGRVLGYAGGLLVLTLLLLLYSTSWTATLGGSASGERLRRMEASPQFADGRFHNLGPGSVQPTGSQWEAMKAYFRGSADRVPPAPLPAMPRAETVRTLASPPASGLRVTWIGHSTLLIEIDEKRFLTDPVFSDRASPFSFLGGKRFQPPAVALEDLPPLDGVILSHDHYDHLDLHSIRALNQRGVTFYAPLGVGAHLERWGVDATRIVEHDWGEETKLGEFTLAVTPAHHFSGRRLIDNNRTLWCSWVIAGPGHRIFFSGDSGLAPFFASIGERYGPFDVAFMDIGASHPSWADIHFGPHHALTAAQMLGARRFVPIHWGTFNLALHAWDEPVETLLTVAAERGVEVVTPPLEAPTEPTTAALSQPWWRAAKTGR